MNIPITMSSDPPREEIGRSHVPARCAIAAATGWGAVFGTLAFVAGGMGLSVSNPAHYQSAWSLAWLFGAIGMLACLAGARRDAHWQNQVAAVIGIALSLAGAWTAIAYYFANYRDYPWAAVLIFALLGVGGTSACGLKSVGIVVSLFLAAWLGPALRPPRLSLPGRLRANGLEVTLLPRDPTEPVFLHLQIRDLAGRALSKDVDMDRVELGGDIGPLIKLRQTHAFALPVNGDSQDRPDLCTMNAMFPVRWWTRSLDLRVAVDRWPAKPVCALRVPLAPLSHHEMSTANGTYLLTVAGARWGMSRSRLPAERVLQLVVTCGHPDSSGGAEPKFRICDDRGDSVEILRNSITGTGDQTTENIDVGPIDLRAKWLNVELFDAKSVRSNQAVFDFRQVPAR